LSNETTGPFETSWEHLVAELAHLDLLLQREVLRWRRGLAKDTHDVFRTVYISDGEIDQLLGDASASAADYSRLESVRDAAASSRSIITERRRRNLEAGAYLALPQLAHLFGLTPFEEQVVLICLAAELDLKYERIYAYLQDDLSRRKPSVDLVLRLLCESPEERLQARGFFSPQSVLFRSQILRYQETAEQHLPARTMKLDDPIAAFLLGTGGTDAEIAACTRELTAADDLPATPSAEEMKSKFVETTRNHFQGSDRSQCKMLYHFYGLEGAGKKCLAAGICAEIGVPVLAVDLRELASRSQSFESVMRSVFREGILRPAAIYLDHFDALLEDESKSRSYLRVVAACVDEFSWLTFIGTEKAWEPAGLFKHHRLLVAELPMPDVTSRTELWKALDGQSDTDGIPINWHEVAAKFRLTPGQMKNALTAARNYAHQRSGSSAISAEDLYRGCRSQSNQRLGTLARKLKPRYTWSDITLPANSLAQLAEICGQMKHRQTVYGEWGFGEKHSLGRGLCVLFFGTSGTGKTMAVEIIANELMLDVYKIDLSTVVSKYIGETERNLSKVFSEAEASNAILFFDEADALFGKRSEVKDAHDRYANIEINYLLQRMEEFEGLAILASNLRKNIDEAFFRRMHFAVEFPFPDQGHRYAIWKQHFPASAPVSGDIDFDFLASRFNVAGGNIKNIVVNAAFLAAANSGVINMKHIVKATRREFEKVGRLCTDADFAPYHVLLQEP
jgi:SpoVK/Ycf46/Vps4 family AAA+-type ATPase